MEASTTTPDYDASVVRALKSVNEKPEELNDEQRARALAAPSDKAGLRGKALAQYVLDGTDLKEQQQQARETAKAEKKANKASAKTNGNAARGRTRDPHARSRSMYGDDLVKAGIRGRELTQKHGPVSKQHKHVRDALGDPIEALNSLEDPKVSQKELKEIADGSAPRGSGRKLKPLAEKVNGNEWTKGRNLAAILVAWIEEKKRAERQAK